MNKDDRRVRKTKKALYEAMAALLNEKNIQKISIKELTDKADINRATFYTHYQDIYDLYEQMENNTMQDIGSIIYTNSIHTYDDILKDLVCYINDNQKVMGMFLNENTKYSFYNRFSNYLEIKYLELLKNDFPNLNITTELNYFIQYHIHGFLAILTAWVEKEYLDSKEKIIELLIQLDITFERFLKSVFI